MRDGWIEIPDILARLDACDDVYFDAVSQVRLPQWSRGRVALVGDAAYCPSLLAGEGAGLAMTGAYVLAGELARSAGDHAAAFAAYERRLRAFIDGKQRSAARFARSFAPATRVGLFVRDQVIRLAAFPPVGRWLAHGFLADPFELPRYA